MRTPQRVSCIQRLMWAVAVVEADPLPDGACGMLDAVEALLVEALPVNLVMTRSTLPFRCVR